MAPAKSSRSSDSDADAPVRRRRTTTRRTSAAAEDSTPAESAPKSSTRSSGEGEPFGFDPEEFLAHREEEAPAAPRARAPRATTPRTTTRRPRRAAAEEQPAAEAAPPEPKVPDTRYARPASRAPRETTRSDDDGPVRYRATDYAEPAPRRESNDTESYQSETSASYGGEARDRNETRDRGESRDRGEFRERDDAPRSSQYEGDYRPQESGEGGQEGGGGGGDHGGPRRPPRRRRRRGGDRPNDRGGDRGGRPQGQGGGYQNQRSGYDNRGGQRYDQGGSRGRRGGGQRNQRDRSYDRDKTPLPAGENLFSEDVQTITLEGCLELHPKGYGFLRDPKNNYAPTKSDPFVSGTFVEKMGIREGVMIRGEVIPGSRGQGPRLKSVETLDGRSPEDYQKVRNFDQLTPVTPFEQIRLETESTPLTMRVMDLLTPIGKGQRALLVAPPRTGKTMLLQEIAHAVTVNHPEIHVMMLLIDERPEEVTEMQRHVRGEVIASSLDRDVDSHVRIAQLVVERGKRLAEEGRDVFILLDSITRTARAFNKWVNNSGRTGSGGLDVKAMDIPKKLFGTARRFEEGGSLTIVGTALIETGSRMDDVIFEEFKGTGNMELVLSRQLADRRIWPAIDITKSGTRREEKLLSPETMEGVTMLRRSLITLSPVEAMEQLTRILAKYPSNKEFVAKIRNIL